MKMSTWPLSMIFFGKLPTVSRNDGFVRPQSAGDENDAGKHTHSEKEDTGMRSVYVLTN